MLEIQKLLQRIDSKYVDPKHFICVLEDEGLIPSGNIKQIQHPYYPELFLFSYTIDADFSLSYVKECRGLILNSTNNEWSPVSWGFKKFHNSSEPLADVIDWNNISVYEKLDGSLLTLWFYKDKWHVNTTGSPNAGGPVNNDNETFSELFWRIFKEKKYSLPNEFSGSYQNITFMFELMTPKNQIVVRHESNNLVLIGARWKDTGKEIPVWSFRNCYEIVKQFNFTNHEQINEFLKEKSPFEQEGFVVLDKSWNRVKIKSSQYVRMHHMRSSYSEKKCLELELNGESSEFISYFPEFKSTFDNIKSKIENFNNKYIEIFNNIKNIETQKDFALQATKNKVSGFLFSLRKGETNDVRDYLRKLNNISKSFELLENN